MFKKETVQFIWVDAQDQPLPTTSFDPSSESTCPHLNLLQARLQSEFVASCLKGYPPGVLKGHCPTCSLAYDYGVSSTHYVSQVSPHPCSLLNKPPVPRTPNIIQRLRF